MAGALNLFELRVDHVSIVHPTTLTRTSPGAPMATLYDARFRVTDASNNPLNGGKVRVYLADTTTLADVFSDRTLSTPLANPVVADSSGWAPAIFLASGNYDIATLTSGDVVVKTTDDVPALGSDSATFSKDFTNSRVAIRGSGGVVYLDAGDASPDNSGGQLSIGGWLATQADSIALNGAAVNVGTSDGALTENSKKISGVVYATGTFSAAATVDIPLNEAPSGVRLFYIDIIDLVLSNNTAGLYARFSYDGGGTYKSGAADYAYIGTAAAAQILWATDPENTSGKPALAHIEIMTPDSGTDPTVFASRLNGYDSTGSDPEIYHMTGYGLGSYGRATHVRILPTAGTISGSYRVLPQRGFE